MCTVRADISLNPCLLPKKCVVIVRSHVCIRLSILRKHGLLKAGTAKVIEASGALQEILLICRERLYSSPVLQLKSENGVGRHDLCEIPNVLFQFVVCGKFLLCSMLSYNFALAQFQKVYLYVRLTQTCVYLKVL